MSTKSSAPRSWLFVPGDRNDRFDKAFNSGADAIILDLEDAVSPANKAAATQAITEWLTGRQADPAVSVWVRTPDADTVSAELKAMSQLPGLTGFVLPKVESATQVAKWPLPVMAQVETAIGILRVVDIAGDAPDNLFALAVGVEDLALTLQCESNLDGLRHACAQTVLAARAFGQYVYACPGSIAQFRDIDAWRQTLDNGKALGSDGALCIHPAQLGPVNEVFSPSQEQLEKAARIVEAFDKAMQAGQGAIQLDGQMLDAPIVEKARALLQRAPDK